MSAELTIALIGLISAATFFLRRAGAYLDWKRKRALTEERDDVE